MKNIKMIALSILALLFVSNSLVAQVISAQVSSKKAQVGVPFEYTVVFTENTGNFSPPSFKDFDIVSGPNQSSSYQNVNGVGSQQIIISYGLVAKREGKLVIGSASTTYNNQRFETSAITIEAAKNNAGGNANESQSNARVSGEDLFIKTIVSKTKCFIGEEIVVTQKLYSRLQIVGFGKIESPNYDGFFSQAQELPNRGQVPVENLDGVNYYTYELFKSLAVPNKSGKLSLNSLTEEVVVRRQATAKPRNIFEQFFGAASYEDTPIKVKSRSTVIQVMQLPEEGKPESFYGAVGNFSSKVEVSRNQLKANEAFNLKMTISGKGNLKLVNAPKINLPEGFESYEPKVIENHNSKTFDYLVIPRNEGEYTLKNIDFSYFNLDSKKYVTLPSGEIKITVAPGDANSAGAQVYSPHSQIKETENDIRYIKKGQFNLAKGDQEFFNSSTHIFLLILPLLALLAALLFWNHHVKTNSNYVLVNERKAAKLAKKQLLLAEKLMNENNKDGFYTEVLLALQNYLSNKLNITIADLSKENIQKILKQRLVDEPLLNILMTTIETSEFAKYAPSAVSGDLNTVYIATSDLIIQLEQQLNKKVG